MSDVVLITPELIRSMPLPFPDRDADKNSRGTVIVVGGSTRSPGGPLLAGLAVYMPLHVGLGW